MMKFDEQPCKDDGGIPTDKPSEPSWLDKIEESSAYSTKNQNGTCLKPSISTGRFTAATSMSTNSSEVSLNKLPDDKTTTNNSADYSYEQEVVKYSILNPKEVVANTINEKNDPEEEDRLVLVKYFLDRPGYDLKNCSSRFWINPPHTVNSQNILHFLVTHKIPLDHLLVEVYSNKYECFMILEALAKEKVEWDFSHSSRENPYILNLRLTDLQYARQLDETANNSEDVQGKSPMAIMPSPNKQTQHANTVPAGLFSFSMMVGLETAELMGRLVEGSVAGSFALTWGPYMFFTGGLLQTIVGIFQVLRNNIYGAVAFLGFGSFWFANGSKVILNSYFTPEDVLAGESPVDPWGNCIRQLYVLLFSLALFKQTFQMNKLSSTLIFLLCMKLVCGALSGFSFDDGNDAGNLYFQWGQVVFGWITSFFAFYVFMAEFTNEVHHKQVFNVHKWSDDHSPQEVFGAAGRQRITTLYSKAARLRSAGTSVSSVRSISPETFDENNSDGKPVLRASTIF
eukprot:scaffold63999_cov51-Attheya_sp.AAC.2